MQWERLFGNRLLYGERGLLPQRCRVQRTETDGTSGEKIGDRGEGHVYPLPSEGGIDGDFPGNCFTLYGGECGDRCQKKEIDIRFTVAAGILLVLLRVFGFSRDWKLTLLNFVPCAVLFAANRLSPGAVGTGDVLVAGMLGFLLPGTELMRCMTLGFWLAGGWGLIRRVWKRGGQREEIPHISRMPTQ